MLKRKTLPKERHQRKHSINFVSNIIEAIFLSAYVISNGI